MKKELFQEIEIPEGIEVKIDDATILVKGPEGENERTFNKNKLVFEIKDNKIFVGQKLATKTEKKMMNTFAAHIKNMIAGVQNKFEYTLKVCSTHFPINLEVEGKSISIKNFLGEKIPRNAKILDGSDVKIEGDIITVTSLNKELAGQTAANFETATRIGKRDRRVFQDGIFIINKAGKEI